MLNMLLVYGALGSAAFAQSDFAAIGTKWYYEWNMANYRQVDSLDFSGYALQEAVSDTLIHGITARKLERTAYYRNSTNNNIISWPRTSLYVYATADTVFCFDEPLDRFLPIYIFNVNAGDTVNHRIPSAYTATISDTSYRTIIDSIVYRTVDGHPVKGIYHHTLSTRFPDQHFYAEPYFQYFGQLNGALDEYLISYIPEDQIEYYKLRCYIDANIDTHFGTDTTMLCDYIALHPLSNRELDVLAQQIQVYPNPARTEVKILLPQEQLQSVTVTDILGRSLFTALNKSKSDHMQLDMSSFGKGTYIIQVTVKDKGIIYKKLVLQ